MSQQTKKSHDKENAKSVSKPKPEGESSPWTEPFQRSQDSGAFDFGGHFSDQKHAHHAHAEKQPADQDTDEATRDALSTIYHGL